MNNLNTLRNILEVVVHADREFTVHTPLYKIKALFDGLQERGGVYYFFHFLSTRHADILIFGFYWVNASLHASHIN